MSLKIDRVELEIVIKNDENRKQLRQLEDDMRRVRKELKKLPEGQEEWTKKKNELVELQKKYDAIYDKIGLTGLSLKELRQRQNELNAVIKQLPGNSPLLEKYRKQAVEVSARIKELNGQAKSTGLSLSKLAEGANKYFGLITAFIATVTGISLALRKSATDVAHMDDVYSDVMKTTNLTREEVVGLNEDLKKMDTRTSREALNNLARDAGKLGIEGSENIKDFIDAGNQINVALGEDLGEDAIKNIGKMVGVYKDATKELQNSGLKEQMLAVGSAVNQLGATSSADESYLVEFAGRLGGIARQAKIAMDDVLGFGSALDQDMQQVEMASTAFSNFIQKLMANPAKFAKLAGLEVNGFIKLLNTDANAAIKQVLRAMNEKGGFQSLIPIFQDMGMDGSRAVGVLSSMAASIDKIDEAQRQANSAMEAGTSVTKEYEIKNNNLAAKLDKAKKQFFEVSLQLGESLNPILLKTTNLTTYLIRGLVKIIPYFPEIGKGLLILTGYLVAYNGKLILNNLLLKEGFGLQVKQTAQRIKDAVVLQATTIKEAIHAATVGKTTIATKAAAAAQVLWNMAMNANPLGIFIGVLTTVTALWFLFAKRTKEVTELQKAQSNIQKAVSEQYDEQKSKVDVLVDMINNEKLALDQRKRALKDLREMVPGYHAELTDEGKLINNNTEAIREYLKQLERETRFQAAKDELTALYRQRRQLQRQLEIDKGANSLLSGSNISKKYPGALAASRTKIDDTKSKLTSTDVAISSIEQELNKSVVVKSTIEVGSTRINEDGKTERWDGKQWVVQKSTSGGAGSTGTDKESQARKQVTDAMRKVETDYYNDLKKAKEDYLSGALGSEFEYGKKVSDIQNGYDSDRKKKLRELLKTIGFDSVKIDILNQISEIEKAAIDRQIEQNDKIRKIILDADPRKAEEQEYNNRLRETGLFGVEKEKMTAEQLEAFSLLEAQHNEAMRKISSKSAKLSLQQLETEQANEEKIFAEARSRNEISEEAYQDKMQNINLAYLKKKLQVQGLSAEQIESITKEIQDKQNEITLNGIKDRQALLEHYGLSGIKSQKEAELGILKYYEDKGTLSHAEAERVRNQISEKYRKENFDKASQYFNAIGSVASQSSDVFSNLQSADEQRVELKYKKLISAAQANGADTTKLEEKKEKELSKVRSKYADIIFAMAVAQTIAQTAVSAMNVYAATSVIPFVGPVLAPIAAGVTIAYGATQIALAKQQRDAAKAGYYFGGFTPDDPDDSTEVGVVHANEFVTTAKGVRNPHIKQFLDVFDVAQKKGTIHLLNTTQILEQTKLSAGSRRSGGYTSENRSSAYGSYPIVSSSDDDTRELLRLNSRMLLKLSDRLEKPIRAHAVISGDDGIYKKTKDYETMIGNASR